VAGGVNLDSAYAAELIAHAGFDAVIVDLQHAPLDPKGMLAVLQAIAATPATPIVRVSWNHPPLVMQALDAGALGVIVPMVNTRADCEAFVRSCLYAPAGERSWGPVRGLLYGGPDYFETANASILPLIQIETAQAVDRIDDILSVPGLGGIYLGPTDLAITLGLHPQRDLLHPRLHEAIASVLAACRRHGVLGGLYIPGAEFAHRAIRAGAQLITAGGDVGFIQAGAQASLSEFKALVAACQTNWR